MKVGFFCLILLKHLKIYIMYKAKFTFESLTTSSLTKVLITINIVLEASDKFKAEKTAIVLACKQIQDLSKTNLLYYSCEEFKPEQEYKR